MTVANVAMFLVGLWALACTDILIIIFASILFGESKKYENEQTKE